MVEIFRINPENKGDKREMAIRKAKNRDPEDNLFYNEIKMKAGNEYEKIKSEISLNKEQYEKFFLIKTLMKDNADRSGFNKESYLKTIDDLKDKSIEELLEVLDKKKLSEIFNLPAFAMAFLHIFNKKIEK